MGVWLFLLAMPWVRGKDLAAELEAIRAKAELPALAGAVFTADGTIEEEAAVGVRKWGSNDPVTIDDPWHLGSDTKMMTATLAATFVKEGKLSWDAKVISFFPECASSVPMAMRSVTVGQILSHRAGLKPYGTLPDLQELCSSGSLMAQRRVAARIALTAAPGVPGTFVYSNADYIVMGAILEQIGGKPWETLIRERLFQPLGMRSSDFGENGMKGRPWPHLENGVPAPENNPYAVPSFVAPAGLVHCPMADWVRFLSDQLRGAVGQPALLPASLYHDLQTPPPGGDYAYGWGSVERDWAGGMALNHNGSDGMNYAVCWLAPAKGFGVIVCTNEGGNAAVQACDDVASLLIERHQARAGK